MANKYRGQKKNYTQPIISNRRNEVDEGTLVRLPPRDSNRLVKIVRESEKGNRYKPSNRLN